MTDDQVLNKLGVIANLLALQATKDMEKEDTAWTLKSAGMANSAIAHLMGISADAVSAHVSNKKKKIQQTIESKPKKRKVDEQ